MTSPTQNITNSLMTFENTQLDNIIGIPHTRILNRKIIDRSRPRQSQICQTLQYPLQHVSEPWDLSFDRERTAFADPYEVTNISKHQI